MHVSQRISRREITKSIMDFRTGPFDEVTIKWLESSDGVLARVEFMVILGGSLLFIFATLSSYRRRSPNLYLRFVLWTACALSGILVSYTVGLMGSAGFTNELFAVWAIFLLLVLGSATSISTYSVDDNDQWKEQKIEQLVQAVSGGLILNSYALGGRFARPLILLWALSLLKLFDRVDAFRKPYGISIDTKTVADYMHLKVINSQESYNNVLVVAGEEKVTSASGNGNGDDDEEVIMDKVITLDKIRRCPGRLLRSEGDPEGRLKDVCLSFALFKLLALRCDGYTLPPSTTGVFGREFFSRVDDVDHEWAFMVIETELAFLFDFFYTKYPVIFARVLRMLFTSSLTLVGSFWVVTMLINYQPQPGDKHFIDSSGGTYDLTITFVVVFTFICMEVWQTRSIVYSDWAKVLLVCGYVEKESWRKSAGLEKVLGFLCRRRRISKPWSNKIRQYSLLKFYNYKPMSEWLFRPVLVDDMDEIRRGQKASDAIELPEQVKKAIVRALKSNPHSLLTNGVSALERNRVSSNLSWACVHETNAHTILVWHVATTLCEWQMQISEGDTGTWMQSHGSDRRVANYLSGYCVYLVAFVPQLLPDGYTTAWVFDDAVEEAQKLLKGRRRSMESRFEKVMKEQGDSVIGKGARLGQQMMEEMGDVAIRWKVLAEFWAELMVYLAPSDQTTAHAESLAMGGEFITHVWALLTHLGMKRPDPQPGLTDASS